MWRANKRRSAGARKQSGQTATEFMMVVSVIVIGVAAMSYVAFDSQGTGGPIKQALTGLLDSGSGGSSELNIPDQVNRGYISPNP